MLGLIKQLAKLITIAKMLPKIPKLARELTSSPEDIALTLTMGVYADEIDAMISKNEQSLDDITDSLNQTSQERIQEIQDSNASPQVKQTEIDKINQENAQRISQLRASSGDDLRDSIDEKLKEKAKTIEPSIQAALAPPLALIGIPAGLVYVIRKISAATDVAEKLSTLGSTVSLPTGKVSNVDVIDPAQAEAAFNADINAQGAADGGGYPVGNTTVASNILLTFSSTEDSSFKYDESGTIQKNLYLFVKDDVTDDPDYRLTLKSYGVNFPSNQKNRVTYAINPQGQISMFWNNASIDTNISQPSFDSTITFDVEGWKKTEKKWYQIGNQRDRAFNTFVIPVKFQSTYPQ